VAATVNLGANDSVTPPAAAFQVVIVTQPLNGTVAPLGINTASVTYTPAFNFSGTDTFQYVLIDTAGAVSNVATVTMTIAFVPQGPTANPDDFAMVVNTALAPSSKTVNVLANDVASPGTTINAASVKVTTLPLHGTVVVNADGTIKYTPLANYLGGDSFQYTVANNFAIASAPATVNLVVFSSRETISYTKASYITSKSAWTIVGSTSWFGPTLTHTTITCRIGNVIGAGALLGTAPIDTTGKFQLVPPTLTTPAPDATHLFNCVSSNGGGQAGVVTVQ
jgi:hypothetical protein